MDSYVIYNYEIYCDLDILYIDLLSEFAQYEYNYITKGLKYFEQRIYDY